MIGIIGGSSLLKSSLFEDWRKERIVTPFGPAELRLKDNFIFLQRHGEEFVFPPHRINHRANLWALFSLEVKKILSINSVGSLKKPIRPGIFVIPLDFISFYDVPTFYDEEMKFIVPRMDRDWAFFLYELTKELKIKARIGGIYIQTKGPRLETQAEVRMLKRFGDIVGMTMASEATLSLELGISYASLCSVDNYCNGILERPLSIEEIESNVKRNLKQIESFINLFMDRCKNGDPY